jgi:hypothetical protein
VELSNHFLSFRRIPFATLALCCLLTVGVMMANRHLPARNDRSLMTINSCALPCVFGVTPGVTRRDHLPETFARIPMSYLTFDSNRALYVFRQNRGLASLQMMVSFGSDNDLTVRAVQLYQTSPQPVLGTLSDFLLAGYRPTRVFTDCQNAQQVVITLGDEALFAQVSLKRVFDPYAPVLLVGAGSNPATMEQAIVAFNCAAERQWMGFALRWKYFPVEA